MKIGFGKQVGTNTDRALIPVTKMTPYPKTFGMGGKNNLVKDCTASDNGEEAASNVYGIYVSSGSTVTGNTVYNNGTSATGYYVYGIYAGSGSTVTGNTAYYNGYSADGTVYGIYLGGYNLVDQNTAYSNGTSAAGSVTNMNLGVGGCVYGINVAP